MSNTQKEDVAKRNASIVTEAVDAVMKIFQSKNFAEDMAYTIIRRSKDEAPIPMDNWSPLNRLLVLMYTRDARGWSQWKEVFRWVKRGSKAIHIIAPTTRKIKAEDSEDGKEKVIITGFRSIPVFRVEDTEGKELPTVDYTPAKEDLPPYLDVAEYLGIKVKWQPMCRPALGWYSPRDKEIVMCSTDYVNYFHELIHLCQDLRFEKLEFLDTNYCELVAETGAAVLAHLNGIEGFHHASYEYLKQYTKDKSDKAALSAISGVLNMVEKVVTFIVETAEQIKLEKQKE